ncbi:hypothetical protein GUITHDRAFT_121454 [Guillardia theta CCMP2712]|uniref:RWP-RK domain-containing protein n=2 Tax=Guillardia theta TaxID=55529 RepID=L1I955_GUITC|nr:hypothetical protein GUITHDRAFT_121454 [Guillardia theta CCMP2712]EKX32375.1 hypothetical protein GUITHDRAFT_121454 [Guillardia theta CCMP2712]|eukprot:XP_005819355.1 hypothetical protein GUITHDRAFT_121454 [Guillardia theta CCMP2712]
MATQHPAATGPTVLVQARPRDSERRDHVRLDLATVSSLYHLRQIEAAQFLGISLTSLKSACRRLGVERWPYRRETAQEAVEVVPDRDDGVGPAFEDAGGVGLEPQEEGENGVEEGSEMEGGWLEWYMSFPLGGTDDDNVENSGQQISLGANLHRSQESQGGEGEACVMGAIHL